VQCLKERCPVCNTQLYGEVNASNEKDIFATIYCLRCGYEREVRDE